jgi:hypothetical protein
LSTVLADDLRNGGAEYHIKELRLAYRSRMNLSPFTWEMKPTPFVANYLLLARAEGVLRRHKFHLYSSRDMMTVSESKSLFDTTVVPNSANVCLPDNTMLEVISDYF